MNEHPLKNSQKFKANGGIRSNFKINEIFCILDEAFRGTDCKK